MKSATVGQYGPHQDVFFLVSSWWSYWPNMLMNAR